MSSISDRSSYTSANALPIKLLKDRNLLTSIIEEGKILPRHVQISPTNKCNLNCSFCSCSNREKSDEISKDRMSILIDSIGKNNCVGVTITGGGEPSVYPHINWMIETLSKKGIKIGLVSNGIPIRNIKAKNLKLLTWVRISFSDDRTYNDKFIDNMKYLKDSGSDCAFSYVITNPFNIDNICDIIQFANTHTFTHVRLVWDIYSPGKLETETKIKLELSQRGISDDLVIYQRRDEFSKGNPRCLISLLKPLIASNGFIYPCCGVQYALPSEVRSFPEQMVLGEIEDFDRIINSQIFFDGSKCIKCYYENYNTILNFLVRKQVHTEFI